jgi:hypothetical protein
VTLRVESDRKLGSVVQCIDLSCSTFACPLEVQEGHQIHWLQVVTECRLVFVHHY